MLEGICANYPNRIQKYEFISLNRISRCMLPSLVIK